VPGIGSAIRTAIFFYLSTEGLKAVPENVVAIDPPVQDKLKAVLRGPGAEGGTADRMAGKSTSVPSLEKGKLSFGFS
jgi:hypothetical protein